MTTQTLIIRPNEQGIIVVPISEALINEYARTIPEAGKNYKKKDKPA